MAAGSSAAAIAGANASISCHFPLKKAAGAVGGEGADLHRPVAIFDGQGQIAGAARRGHFEEDRVVAAGDEVLQRMPEARPGLR